MFDPLLLVTVTINVSPGTRPCGFAKLISIVASALNVTEAPFNISADVASVILIVEIIENVVPADAGLGLTLIAVIPPAPLTFDTVINTSLVGLVPSSNMPGIVILFPMLYPVPIVAICIPEYVLLDLVRLNLALRPVFCSLLPNASKYGPPPVTADPTRVTAVITPVLNVSVVVIVTVRSLAGLAPIKLVPKITIC